MTDIGEDASLRKFLAIERVVRDGGCTRQSSHLRAKQMGKMKTPHHIAFKEEYGHVLDQSQLITEHSKADNGFRTYFCHLLPK